MPAELTFDGHSFAPQLRGEAGTPREWVYVQLGAKWYVCSSRWKLTQDGELYDMKDAPFIEKLVGRDTKDPKAIAAREKLQKALDGLKPGEGKKDKE